MRETLLLFIVLTEYCSSSCLFCPVLSSLKLRAGRRFVVNAPSKNERRQRVDQSKRRSHATSVVFHCAELDVSHHTMKGTW